MIKIKKFKNLFLFACLALSLAACKSIKQPESVITQLDYTKDDVVNSEIENIKRIKKENSVQALWRASFLGKKDIIDMCASSVEEELKQAIKNKDYFEAYRLIKSLKAVDYPVSADYQKTIDSSFLKDVPGLTGDNKRKPVSINDCINATVTVWLDKGWKVQNGAGIADIVIGSGFFIDKRGYLVTNYHVIQDAVNPDYKGVKKLYVVQPEDTEEKIPAVVIGYDSAMDLALLKVEIVPDFVFDLGESSDLSIGDKISVIGTPIGLEGTLTSGIISSINRKLTTMGSVFQIDAAVNSGNSGGPMIDKNNKVQAIVFAGLLQYQGLNFAIPVEYLKQELPLLYNGGEVKHPWIGAFGHDYKVKGKTTALEIQYVMPGGSAHFANLCESDLIKEIDGTAVKSLEDFHYLFLKYTPGTIVECKYETHEKETKKTLLYLDKRPQSPARAFFQSDLMSDSFIPLYGIQMAPINNKSSPSFTITKIIKGSVADEMGFSAGDPVTIVDVTFDDERKYVITKLYVKRRSKGYLDIGLSLGASYDNPYYF